MNNKVKWDRIVYFIHWPPKINRDNTHKGCDWKGHLSQIRYSLIFHRNKTRDRNRIVCPAGFIYLANYSLSNGREGFESINFLMGHKEVVWIKIMYSTTSMDPSVRFCYYKNNVFKSKSAFRWRCLALWVHRISDHVRCH